MEEFFWVGGRIQEVTAVWQGSFFILGIRYLRLERGDGVCICGGDAEGTAV